MTDRLYSDPDLVQFYDIENTGGDDFNYCVGFAGNARSVLDLGCGTGQLAAALSQGRSVTGVDPASPMLDVGRGRPDGDKVDWVEGDARTVRLGRRFDLVLLTGHAFQVFLTAEDQSAVLRTIAEQKLTDVAAVGKALSAGTNCGSCRPAIAHLIAQSELAHAS